MKNVSSIPSYQCFSFDFWACLFDICILIIQPDTYLQAHLHNCFPLCSLYPHMYARAYINFKNQEDIILFRDRFDGYVFLDNKGES